MIGIIREKQKVDFSGKRISLKAIRDIAALMEEEAATARKTDRTVKLIFAIDAGKSSFESTSSILFSEKDGKIENGFVHKISMNLDCFDNSKKNRSYDRSHT